MYYPQAELRITKVKRHVKTCDKHWKLIPRKAIQSPQQSFQAPQAQILYSKLRPSYTTLKACALPNDSLALRANQKKGCKKDWPLTVRERIQWVSKAKTQNTGVKTKTRMKKGACCELTVFQAAPTKWVWELYQWRLWFCRDQSSLFFQRWLFKVLHFVMTTFDFGLGRVFVESLGDAFGGVQKKGRPTPLVEFHRVPENDSTGSLCRRNISKGLVGCCRFYSILAGHCKGSLACFKWLE